MTLRDHLKALSDAVGVAGGENEVRKLIVDALKAKADSLTIDPIGSVTALWKGTGASSLRVMVVAHMDEIGFMVSDVGENGLISVDPIGTHDLRVLPTKRVLVGEAKTPGVILWVPIHRSYGKNALVDVDDLSIDVGAKDKGAVGAKPGDRIAFMGSYAEFGRNLARGKAFDSRAGCAILLELLEGDRFPFDLYLAFTTQQAIGGRGARVASQRVHPDAVVILQGTDCNDLPIDPDVPEEDRAPVVRLGGGPTFSLVDGPFVADLPLVDHLRNSAQAAGIPYQLETQNTQLTRRYASEAVSVGWAQAAIPVASIAVPVRYMRSPNSLVSFDDLDNTVRLLRESLAALTPEKLER